MSEPDIEALDRRLTEAWSHLEEDDPASARQMGEALHQEVPEAPEVPFLLSACAAAEGDEDKALEWLDRAVALDAEWAEPDLRAAELLADRGDLAAALLRAEQAQDKAEEEEDQEVLLEAIALRGGLALELEGAPAARRVLTALPSPAAVNASGDVVRELGHLHLAVEDPARARSWFERATALDPEDADAWHGLGLAAESAGDEAEKRRAWITTLTLDGQVEPPLPERLSEAQMAEVAEEALGELPPRARTLLANVPVLITDRPAPKDVESGLDPRLLGLFSGSAYPEVSALGGTPQLTQILLFRANLERVAADEAELREEIRTTLLHETGHFFGMSEEDLEGVGLG